MAENISELLAEVQDLVAKLEVIGFGGGEESVTHKGITRSTLAKAMNEEVASRWVAIASLAQSRNVVETFAELPVTSDGSVMYDVWNDLVVANNGLYGWDGSAWIKSPFDVNRIAQEGQLRIGKNWLAPSTTHKFQDVANGEAIVSAILAVRGIGVPLDDSYCIVVMAHNDPVYHDRVMIKSSENLAWDTDTFTVLDKTNGPVWVTADRYDGSRFELLIDYGLLAGVEGTLLNSSSPYIPISSLALLEGDQITKNADLSVRIGNVESDAYPYIDSARLDTANLNHVAIASAILSARILKGDDTKDYAVNVFSHQDGSFNNDIWVSDGSNTVARVIGANNVPNPSGITRIVLTQYAASGVEIELYVDYSKLENKTGVLINGSRLWLKLGRHSMPSLIADSVAESAAILRQEMSFSNDGSSLKNLRVSFIGSSTTWGQGYLGSDSYAGKVEDYLRSKLATTIPAAELTTTGTWQVLSNEPMCYQSNIGQLSGVDATVDFELYGDEISIALCLERGNDGASIVELLVDGQVHDTFSTYNWLPSGTDVFNAVGNGSDKTFDLGRAFTYGHVVTLDAAGQTGRMNQGGYGGSFVGDDVWMVVRKLFDLGAGQYEVRHFLTFKDAPANGVAIQCNFSYGETIKPTLSTVGNLGAEIGSGVESSYGGGSTVYDPANPVGLSSGLDFRQNDPRAIKTWRFSDSAVRQFKLRIKSLDSRATGSVPALFLGFVTNRMHYIQNAGIGGYKTSNFLQTNNLTNLRQIASFKPDLAFVKLAANDDWVVHEFKAWMPKTGVTDAELRAVDSSLYLKSISGSGDNYSVDDSRCPIVVITPFSVTFDSAVQLGAVAPGDQIIFGDYKGDNRRLAVRIVDSWSGHTATFKQELLVDDLAHISSLTELVGATAQVKSIAQWDQNIRSIIAGLHDVLPSLKIGLSTDGLPNYNMRRLEGYAEAAEVIAGSLSDVDFVDAYGATKRWTYDQNQNISVYLDASQGTASTGASEYPLFKSDGIAWAFKAPRNLSVKVDGVERINDGCYVRGGEKKGWPIDVVTMTTSNAVTVIDPQVLVFTNNVPAPGAVIEVRYSSAKWSSDDCHPSAVGNKLFGAVAIDALKRIV
jgi:hypothetical protein